MSRWTARRAQDWWSKQPWICGFNFLPSSAVNFLQMWQADTFDKETIARELRWAGRIGFNAVRTNLHPLVWENDRDGLAERVDWLMDAAADNGMRVVPCLFDDCGFGGMEPAPGPQSAPVLGVHNSRAVASPGRARVMDRDGWPVLEAFVTDVVTTFARDERVLFWDLYNEPGNRMIFGPDGFSQYDAALDVHALALMRATFRWARAAGPDQPVTVGAWTTTTSGSADAPYRTDIDRRAIELSDIVTFHAYLDTPLVAAIIDTLSAGGRPVLCTEWMARPTGSTIADQLPLFRDRGIGCFQWGLVRGATQTHLPWPEALVRRHGGHADRSVWFHDLLHPDGAPYDEAEVQTIAALIGAASRNMQSGGR